MENISENKKLVASCSFGKDSLAAIIVAREHGIRIEEAVYCRIMFDKNISAEFPEHEEFIHGKAIPILEKRYGIKTTIVQSGKTYCDQFFSAYGERSRKKGEIYGFPMRMGPWCNDRLKVNPIKKWQKEIGECTAIVGIASDETARINRKTERDNLLPLVKYGITEADAFDICKREDLLSPAYGSGRKRLGCWFCHNQRIGELRRLRREYPHLWNRLLLLDEVSPCKFTTRSTVKQFDERFEKEDLQLRIEEKP